MTAASGGGRYGATGAAWGEDSSEYKDLLNRGGGEKRQLPGRRYDEPTQRTALLRDTIRLTQETQDMADGIMDSLESQKQSLVKGAEQVSEMRGFTHQARRVLAQMARRAACKKATLYGIIAALSLAIVLVLYRELTNHGHLLRR